MMNDSRCVAAVIAGVDDEVIVEYLRLLDYLSRTDSSLSHLSVANCSYRHSVLRLLYMPCELLTIL